MAHNIFREYVDYDKKVLKEYINTITAKKINNKVCNLIVNVYTDSRYYNSFEPVKNNFIDNVEYYVLGNYLSKYAKTDKRKSLPHIIDSLILLRYISLLEIDNKKGKEKKVSKFEEGFKNKYQNSGVLINELIRKIKDNIRRKEKYIEKLAAEDFSVSKKNTDREKIFEIFLDNSVKMPDIYSDIAVNRVYNSGLIYEDRMLVLYLLTVRELLIDSINREYDNKYLVEFPVSLLEKRNKLVNLLRIIENDYLKERMILKIRYSEYKNYKEQCDKLIHEGYSFAVIIDEKIKGSLTLLKVFTYILLNEKTDKTRFSEFDNVINV